MWHAVQGALLSGESPFWLDGQYAGNPLLYHQEAPLFYPPTIPLLLTGGPAYRLADLFSLFHFLLAGLLAARLVKEETGHSGAAALGGVALMLDTDGSLRPLAERGRRGGPRARPPPRPPQDRTRGAAVRRRPFVPVRRASRADGASPGRHRLPSGDRRVRGPRPPPFRLPQAGGENLALSLLVAAAVSAPSVVPTVLLHPEMERAAGLTRADQNTSALSGATVRIVFLPGERQTDSPEAASHPGFAAWVLLAATFAFGRGNRDPPSRSGIAGSAGFVFAFGDSGPYRLLSGLPFLDSLRAPSRYLLSWSLFLALGAALGAAALARRYPRNRFLVPGAILLLGADLVYHARTTAPTVPADCYRVVPRFARMLTGRSPDPSGFPYRHWAAGTALPDARAPGITSADIEREARLPGAIGLRFGLESLRGAGPLAQDETVPEGRVPARRPVRGRGHRLRPGHGRRACRSRFRGRSSCRTRFPSAAPTRFGSSSRRGSTRGERRSSKPPAAAALGGWDPSRGSVRLVRAQAGPDPARSGAPGAGLPRPPRLVRAGLDGDGRRRRYANPAGERLLPRRRSTRGASRRRDAIPPPGVPTGLGVALLGLLLRPLGAKARPRAPNSG